MIIPLPASPTFSSIKISKSSSSFRKISPYTYTQQVFVNSGRMITAEFILPQMSKANAETWINFLDQLYSLENSFQVDLSKWYSGYGLTTFKLNEPTFSFNVTEAQLYGISFTGMEDRL